MVGVRQFDEDNLLEAVMRAFWAKGYAATTMGDLADAALVQRGSLYNAYGGKEELLLAALDRYGDRYGGEARAALKQPDTRQSIEGFFLSHLARMRDKRNPTGCLLCQTAMECGGGDNAASRAVRTHFLRTERALRATLERGRAAGRLAPETDVKKLARFFLGVSRGMSVMHRAYGSLGPVRDMATVALTKL